MYKLDDTKGIDVPITEKRHIETNTTLSKEQLKPPDHLPFNDELRQGSKAIIISAFIIPTMSKPPLIVPSVCLFCQRLIDKVKMMYGNHTTYCNRESVKDIAKSLHVFYSDKGPFALF